jgi:cysteine synthase
MPIRQSLSDAVGHTPLIRLNTFSDETGCEILGKAEFLNPGGSVKDRAALGILDDFERKGLLKPGGTLVEGTAGNTGIGFAHLCNARGYRCVIVMPDNQSPEKAALLRTLGAEVQIVKAVPYADPNHYQKVAPRVAAEIDGAVCGNQFDNTANRDAHYATTGPEIWHETGGRIDAFTCATGTGGTLGGVSRYLKEQKPRLRIVLADPMGSALYNWVKTGALKSEGSSAVTEGIGIGRVTSNLEGAPIDDAVRIEDARSSHRRTGCCTVRACSSAAPAAPTSRPRCASRASSAPATPWSPSSATVATSTSRASGAATTSSRRASSPTPTRRAARSRREPDPSLLRRPARDALGSGRARAGAVDPGHPDRAGRRRLDGRPP